MDSSILIEDTPINYKYKDFEINYKYSDFTISYNDNIKLNYTCIDNKISTKNCTTTINTDSVTKKIDCKKAVTKINYRYANCKINNPFDRKSKNSIQSVKTDSVKNKSTNNNPVDNEIQKSKPVIEEPVIAKPVVDQTIEDKGDQYVDITKMDKKVLNSILDKLSNINIVEAIPLDKSKLNFNQNIPIVTPILTQ